MVVVKEIVYVMFLVFFRKELSFLCWWVYYNIYLIAFVLFINHLKSKANNKVILICWLFDYLSSVGKASGVLNISDGFVR